MSKATRLGKRIEELKLIFVTALGGDAGSSDMLRLRVADAAETKALAELARGNFMRGDRTASLDDVIRIERRAVAAERALGLPELSPDNKAAPSLADILSRYAKPEDAPA